jgi:hypothetical protein
MLLLLSSISREVLFEYFLNVSDIGTRRPVQHLQRFPGPAEAASNLPHTGKQDCQTPVNLSGNKTQFRACTCR